jgi:hypothetical protein
VDAALAITAVAMMATSASNRASGANPSLADLVVFIGARF